MDKIYGTNIKSNVLLIQSTVPYMAPGSSILFINSISAYFPDDSIGLTVGMYAVSKTAMLGMVKAMSQEYADRKIRVNGLSSGIVPTSFGSILTTPDAKAYYVCRSCCQTSDIMIKHINVLHGLVCDQTAKHLAHVHMQVQCCSKQCRRSRHRRLCPAACQTLHIGGPAAGLLCVQEAKIPLKRYATVEEIAGPAAFLLSADASYMTGETIVVGGGIPSRL